jgi:hypothetical protein
MAVHHTWGKEADRKQVIWRKLHYGKRPTKADFRGLDQPPEMKPKETLMTRTAMWLDDIDLFLKLYRAGPTLASLILKLVQRRYGHLRGMVSGCTSSGT